MWAGTMLMYSQVLWGLRMKSIWQKTSSLVRHVDWMWLCHVLNQQWTLNVVLQLWVLSDCGSLLPCSRLRVGQLSGLLQGEVLRAGGGQTSRMQVWQSVQNLLQLLLRLRRALPENRSVWRRPASLLLVSCDYLTKSCIFCPWKCL